MKIYHGSKNIIRNPLAHGSDSLNDYGPSFYLTLDLESAKSWACKNDTIGLANVYDVDSDKYNKLKILDLTDKKKYSFLHWLAILMHFRELSTSFVDENGDALRWLEKYYIDVNSYDVVIGYRADDAYFRFPLQFVSNNLAVEDMEEIFLLGNLGVQHAFMSEKAINLLKFEKAIPCESKFLGHYFSVVTYASNKFEARRQKPKDANKHYILDLIRGNYEI